MNELSQVSTPHLTKPDPALSTRPLSEGPASSFAWLLALAQNQTVSSASSSLNGTSPMQAFTQSSAWEAISSPLEQWLAATLAQVLQQLLASQKLNTSSPAGLPVEGPISQEFHAGHHGTDIAVPVGTPVQATMSGRVVHAGWNNEGYGNLVIVENGSYRTYYAHLDKVPVSEGDVVSAGTIIGLSGNTGNSTGPHVHYEVRVDGKSVSPALSLEV